MMDRRLSQCWETWQANAAEKKTTQHAMYGAVKRMMFRQLSLAFEKWQDEAQLMKREERLLRGFINRMMHGQLSRAWETWQANVAKLSADGKTLLRVVMHMKDQILTSAWAKWYSLVDADAKSNRLTAQKAIKRMQRMQTNKAWATWQDFVLQSHTDRALVRRGLSFMFQINLALAFQLLRNFYRPWALDYKKKRDKAALEVVDHDIQSADDWLTQMERASKEKREKRMALVDEWHGEINDEVEHSADAHEVLDLNTNFHLEWTQNGASEQPWYRHGVGEQGLIESSVKKDKA